MAAARRYITLAFAFAMLAALGGPTVAAAGAPPVEAFPGDLPILLTRAADGTFKGEFRVVARAAIADLRIEPGRLVLENDPSVQVLPSEVQVTQPDSLTADETFSVGVQVDKVPKPGTYTGKIWLRSASEPLIQAISVDVSLLAPASSLSAREGQRLELNLVNCTRDCFLADLAAPGGRPTMWSLVVVNSGSTAATVNGVHYQATGQKAHGSINAAFKLVSPSQVKPGQVGSVYLSVEQDQLPADHYTGEALFTVADQPDPIAVPIDVNVRDGPLLPAFTLILAVAIGIIFRWVKGPGGDLADRYERLAGSS